ncbi:hypothetical protein ACFFRR_004819 [Megaselia abdita]
MIADQGPENLPHAYYDYLKAVLCHEKMELMRYEEEYDNLNFCMVMNNIGVQLKVDNSVGRKSSNPKDFFPTFRPCTYTNLTVENCYPLEIPLNMDYEDDMKRYISEARHLKFKMLKKLITLKWEYAGRIRSRILEVDSADECRVNIDSELQIV